MLSRATIFIYGILCYLVFFATFLYALGFVGDLYVFYGDAYRSYRARVPMIFPLRFARAERRREEYEHP
jgi:protein-S-isoprenylcysteine O-methyltransferase Ste14